MNYEDFLARVTELVKGEHYPRDGVITLRWETGGWSGGSCWGGTAMPYTSDAQPKTIEAILDQVFEDMCPDIRLMAYRKIMRVLEVEPTTRTTDDYYGNHTNYSEIVLDIRRLYDVMIEQGAITA